MTIGRHFVLFLAGLAIISWQAWGGDAELERLKAAANEACATLTVTESSVAQNGRDYLNYEFALDTLARQYRLRYKTFPGALAAENPKQLNDWGSGYGMLEPYPNWYQNGFLTVAVAGAGATSFSIDHLQGQVRPLTTTGTRVGYDLVFAGEAGAIVVRTIALAGREELFVSISGKSNSGAGRTLSSSFRGYPLGFSGPFDRWLHGEGQDIQNAGGERKTFSVKLAEAPWLLLADHKLDPAGKRAGLLGLIYDRKAVAAASLTTGNYSMELQFDGPSDQEQRFIVYTLGPMTWEAARQHLADVRDSTALLDKAFKDLPPAFATTPGPR